MKKVAKRRQIQIAAMESDTTEKESTAASLEPTKATTTASPSASASAELQSPQSESVVGVAAAAAAVDGVQGEGEGDGIGKSDGEATPPPTKRQKIEQDEDANEEHKKELDNNDEEEEEEAPQLVEPVERVQSTQSSLRSFNRIPVFIVDYHNDVLEFIYRCLATRHLPLERNILVHFDSHPDMVVARDIPASASYDKDIMLNELSIENWIMPTLYAGRIPSRFLPRAVYSSSFFPRSLQSRCLAKELMVPADSYRQT